MPAVAPVRTPSRLLHAGAVPAALFAVASLFMVQSAMAQWKWISPAGVVQYSDLPPPPNIPLKNILAKPAAASMRTHAPAATTASGPASASAPAAKDTAQSQAQTQATRELQQKLEQDKRAKEAAQRLQQEVGAQARQANCQQAQRQLQTLDSGVRLAEVDAQGNRAFLTDAQRTAQRQQAMAAVANYCR